MSNDDDKQLAAGDGMVTRRELRERVSVIAPGVVLVRDHPTASASTWAFMAEVARETGGRFDRHVMVLDLSEARDRPKGKHQETIRQTLRDVLTPEHIAVVQPGSMFLRAALKFHMSRNPQEFSIHASLEEALSAARDALERAAR